jgi:hypothetical protein
MLLSARRAVIATCAVATFVLLFAFKRLLLVNAAATTMSESAEAFKGLVPHWTTEQENPRFAYVQYATDFDYLCNAVG